MKRKKLYRRLASSAEAVSHELEARWRQRSMHFRHFPDECFWYTKRTREAYITAKAVVDGMPPESLTDQAILEVLEGANSIAESAGELVGGSKQEGHSAVSTTINADLPTVAQRIKASDLPEFEVAVLRAQGAMLTKKDLKRLLHNLNVGAETGVLDDWLAEREFRGAANTFREATMILTGEIKRRREAERTKETADKQKSRLGVGFFSGIAMVITGAAGVIGDVVYAFGPPFLVPSPHGFDEATYASVVAGVAIAAQGVPSLKRQD